MQNENSSFRDFVAGRLCGRVPGGKIMRKKESLLIVFFNYF